MHIVVDILHALMYYYNALYYCVHAYIHMLCAVYVLVIACICMQLKSNCMSNSQVMAQGEAECNSDCYEYNYSLIAREYMRLSTNHIALPMTLYSYP